MYKVGGRKDDAEWVLIEERLVLPPSELLYGITSTRVVPFPVSGGVKERHIYCLERPSSHPDRRMCYSVGRAGWCK